jgi:hypothetical protein
MNPDKLQAELAKEQEIEQKRLEFERLDEYSKAKDPLQKLVRQDFQFAQTDEMHESFEKLLDGKITVEFLVKRYLSPNCSEGVKEELRPYMRSLMMMAQKTGHVANPSNIEGTLLQIENPQEVLEMYAAMRQEQHNAVRDAATELADAWLEDPFITRSRERQLADTEATLGEARQDVQATIEVIAPHREIPKEVQALLAEVLVENHFEQTLNPVFEHFPKGLAPALFPSDHYSGARDVKELTESVNIGVRKRQRVLNQRFTNKASADDIERQWGSEDITSLGYDIDSYAQGRDSLFSPWHDKRKSTRDYYADLQAIVTGTDESLSTDAPYPKARPEVTIELAQVLQEIAALQKTFDSKPLGNLNYTATKDLVKHRLEEAAPLSPEKVARVHNLFEQAISQKQAALEAQATAIMESIRAADLELSVMKQRAESQATATVTLNETLEAPGKLSVEEIKARIISLQQRKTAKVAEGSGMFSFLSKKKRDEELAGFDKAITKLEKDLVDTEGYLVRQQQLQNEQNAARITLQNAGELITEDKIAQQEGVVASRTQELEQARAAVGAFAAQVAQYRTSTTEKEETESVE